MSTYHALEVLEQYRENTKPFRQLWARLQNITPPPGGVENLPKIESLSDLYD